MITTEEAQRILGTIGRYDPNITRRMIEHQIEKTRIKVTVRDLELDGWIVFCPPERTTNATKRLMDDGHYRLTDKAKRELRL